VQNGQISFWDLKQSSSSFKLMSCTPRQVVVSYNVTLQTIFSHFVFNDSLVFRYFRIWRSLIVLMLKVSTVTC